MTKKQALKNSAAWDARVEVNPFIWMAEHVTSNAELQSSAERDLDFLLAEIPEERLAQARVLDLGCGIGRLTAALSQRAREVVAADISTNALTYAQHFVGDSKNVSYLHLNGEDLDGVTGPFDIIISFATLPHLSAKTLVTYLRECRKLLVDDGYASLQFYVGAEHQFLDSDSFSLRSYEKELLVATITALGYECDSIRALPLPFDGSDHTHNRHPIVATLRPTHNYSAQQQIPSPASEAPKSNLDKGIPKDEEGLVLREVNHFLAIHDLASAHSLLKYWTTYNPDCDPQVLDAYRQISKVLFDTEGD